MLEEVGLVHAHEVEDGGQAHGVLAVELGELAACPSGDICVTAAIDDAASLDDAPARLVLHGDARDLVGVLGVHDGIHEGRVQERPAPSLLEQRVGDELEVLCVEALGVVEGPLAVPASHAGRHPLELLPYALAVHSAALVTVPSQGLHPHGRDDAPEAPEPLQYQHVNRAVLRGRPSGRERGADPRWPPPHNEHVAPVHHRRHEGLPDGLGGGVGVLVGRSHARRVAGFLLFALGDDLFAGHTLALPALY
mmetsp:Transcript_12729/g.25298  ORF Transcript_12729/g.25298 Transcript_12729/m.25298 type:complete len:251 (-) Transcript_12729:51-803(-)